jgi:predicted  nucleic acid-binding Zn-ribbon protein
MLTTMKSTCLVLLTSCVLGGCVSVSNDLGAAANRLDRSADVLSDEVREARNTALQREADEFAEVAEDFNGDVRERVDREELRERFDRVATRYHELRDEYRDERPTSTDERTAFNDVTRAYLDVERELQYRPRDRAYGARDRDDRDRND